MSLFTIRRGVSRIQSDAYLFYQYVFIIERRMMYEIPKKEGFKSISYVCAHGGHFGNVPGSGRCRAGTDPD